MPLINNQLEVERSLEFFTDPQSYTAFDLDESQRRILGCIDPRDQEATKLLTLVQTAGGAVGTGLDYAIARTAATGHTTTIEQGIVADRNVRRSTKLGAHANCKFVAGIPVVLDEMVDPTDFTQNGVERWINYYEFGDDITTSVFRKVQDSARRLRERSYDEAALLDNVDRLYDTKNVVDMSGDNTAQIYVVNHHPHVGLNRQKKHREADIQVQGYHDSLGATIGDVLASRMTRKGRTYVLASLILKEAAVRTVIGDESTLHYEGRMTERGLQVVEAETT